MGMELALDHDQGLLLKSNNGFGCARNLEAHLHLVDGYGKGQRFYLVTQEGHCTCEQELLNFLRAGMRCRHTGGKTRIRR